MKSINQIIVGLESVAEHAEVMSKTPGWSAMAGTYREEASLLREAIALLRTHPDAQHNEPLTLEELREMDGQPVWIDRGPGYGAGWVLVQVWAKSTNIIYLIQANGSVLQLGVEIKNGAKFYRRPPTAQPSETEEPYGCGGEWAPVEPKLRADRADRRDPLAGKEA